MTNLNRYKMNKELALKIKNIVFDNEQRNKDVIDYDELLKEIEEAINYTQCCEELKSELHFDRKTHAKVFNNDTGMWEVI